MLPPSFCAWDDGYLPSEAEWNYAAAGGIEQRAYPWSNPASALAVDCSYANYNINSPSGTFCTDGTTGAVDRVGSASPKGDGKRGQSDLGGNVWEWTLDYFATYQNPCADCAQLTIGAFGSNRVVRGGDFLDGGALMRGAYRPFASPDSRAIDPRECGARGRRNEHVYNVGQ
jgi:formylglycine-generating enzyme required for sulfatase activity